MRPAKSYIYFVISPRWAHLSEGMAPVKILVVDNTSAGDGGWRSRPPALRGQPLRERRGKHEGFTQVLWLAASTKYLDEVGTMNTW